VELSIPLLFAGDFFGRRCIFNEFRKGKGKEIWDWMPRKIKERWRKSEDKMKTK
jgi:hypothetical protein